MKNKRKKESEQSPAKYRSANNCGCCFFVLSPSEAQRGASLNTASQQTRRLRCAVCGPGDLNFDVAYGAF